MPSFVSALFGIAAALPITGLLWTADILPTDSFWLALVSPPFLTAFIVGGLTWLWLRYSPEEAQAPLQCAENQLSQLDSQRTEWARLLTNAEGALAKLQSKRI